MIRIPGKSYCRECYNKWQREKYHRDKAETEAYLLTHNEFGEEVEPMSSPYRKAMTLEELQAVPLLPDPEDYDDVS